MNSTFCSKQDNCYPTWPRSTNYYLAPNYKLGDTRCFIFFTFCNVKWFWELLIPFSEYLMQSRMRKVAWFQCLSCQLTLTWRQWMFTHLLNPDWSIRISRSSAVCMYACETDPSPPLRLVGCFPTCKLKCYVKPMKDPLGISPSKGNQGTTWGKEKTDSLY